MKALLSIFFLVLINGQAYSQEEIKLKNKVTLTFKGDIGPESFNKIYYYFLKNKDIKIFEIDSDGGNIIQSILIAKEIRNRGIHLVVKNKCNSGCTYIFLGAIKKELLPNSILGFHHSLSNNLSEKEKSQIRLNHLKSEGINNSTHSTTLKNTAIFEQEYMNLISLNADMNSIFIGEIKKQYPELKITRKILIQTKNEVKEFETNFLERLRLAKYIFFLKINQIDFERKLQTQNPYGSIVFFPSKKRLEDCGVREIEKYTYPEDKKSFLKEMKNKGNDFQIVFDEYK